MEAGVEISFSEELEKSKGRSNHFLSPSSSIMLCGVLFLLLHL